MRQYTTTSPPLPCWAASKRSSRIAGESRSCHILEQQALYDQYHFDEPWDGPNNRKLIDQMPAVYSAAGPDGNPSSRSNASYYVFAGEAAALGSPQVPGGKSSEPTFEMITDGLSNTILAVEWQGNIPWTKPD